MKPRTDIRTAALEYIQKNFTKDPPGLGQSLAVRRYLHDLFPNVQTSTIMCAIGIATREWRKQRDERDQL